MWRRYGCAIGVFAGVIAMVVSIPLPDALVSLGPSPGIDPMPMVRAPGTGFDAAGLRLLVLPLAAAAFPVAALAARRPRLTSGAAVPGGLALVLGVGYLVAHVRAGGVVFWQIGEGTVLMVAAALLTLVCGLLAVRSRD